MGSDPISSATPTTTIYASLFNKIVSAIKGDLVPRNSSGISTESAGSLGTSTLPWLKLFLGAAASQISLDESSGKLRLNVGANNYVEVSQTELAFYISGVKKFSVDTNKINRQYLGAPNYAESGSFNLSTTSSSISYSPTTVSITTTGRPVFFGAMNGYYSLAHNNISASPSIVVGSMSVTRSDGTGSSASVSPLQRIESASMPTKQIISGGVTMFGIDTPAAGTTTYRFGSSVVVTSGGGDGSLTATGVDLFAWEM